MAYNPNPADPTQPTEDKFVESAAKEFRELKEYIQELVAEVAANEGSVAALESRALRVLPPETVAGLAIAPSRANKLLGFDPFGQPAYYPLDSSPAIPSASTNWLYVNEYGTHWDGVTDNTADIRLAHNTANASGRPVSYAGIVKFVIQANARIPMQTSTNFASAEIIVINGVSPPPLAFPVANTTYVCSDPMCPIVTVTGAIAPADLKKGSLFPTRGLFDGHGYAGIECGLQIPNRDLNGTVNYEQAFKVNRHGEVSHPLSTDLSAFAGAISVRYRRTSLKPLVISNFCLKEDPSKWNELSLITVTRCNTVIENFTLLFDPPGDAYNNVCQIISLASVSDIIVRNIVASGRPNNVAALGTYVLNMGNVADIYVDKMNAITGWGATASLQTNGIYFTNCVLNRVDGHEGLHNVFVDKCALHEFGVLYGWGGGIISVSRSTMYQCRAAISSRTDYSNQHFGTLIVDDCNFVDVTDTEVVVIDMANFMIGAPGILPVVAPDMIINNVRRLNAGLSTNAAFIPFKLKVVPGAVVYAPRLLSASTMRAPAGWKFAAFVDWRNLEANPIGSTRILLDDIYATQAPSNAQGLQDYPLVNVVTSPVILQIKAESAENLFVRCMSTFQISILISDSSVCGVEVDPATLLARVELSNCRLTDAATGLATAPIGGLASTGPGTGFTILQGCLISSVAFDLSKVAAIQGCLLRTPGLPPVPAGVTAATMFSGYKAAGIFL